MHKSPHHDCLCRYYWYSLVFTCIIIVTKNIITLARPHIHFETPNTLLQIWLLDFRKNIYQYQIQALLIYRNLLISWVSAPMVLNQRPFQIYPWYKPKRQKSLLLEIVFKIIGDNIIIWKMFNFHFPTLYKILSIKYIWYSYDLYNLNLIYGRFPPENCVDL